MSDLRSAAPSELEGVRYSFAPVLPHGATHGMPLRGSIVIGATHPVIVA